jgi:CDP-diacylglycerol---glycerol-3-phosphate 3-phosphatidyltransferase
MLSGLIEDWARGVARGIMRIFQKTPLSPNAVTVIGCLLHIPLAWVLANGWWWQGGLLMLFAGGFDMLDGALAKVKNRVSTFGAFLDSTLDRYGEILTLLGLLLYYRNNIEVDNKTWGSVLVYASICGALMVSYARARAEGLGMECKTGLLARPERIVILAIGCLLMPFLDMAVTVCLWGLAIGTNFTAIQRIIHIYLTSLREEKKRAQLKSDDTDQSAQERERELSKK